MRGLTSMTETVSRSGSWNISMLKQAWSNPEAFISRTAMSRMRSWTLSGRCEGYSKRWKLMVPGYITESTIPITTGLPRSTKPSTVTCVPDSGASPMNQWAGTSPSV